MIENRLAEYSLFEDETDCYEDNLFHASADYSKREYKLRK